MMMMMRVSSRLRCVCMREIKFIIQYRQFRLQVARTKSVMPLVGERKLQRILHVLVIPFQSLVDGGHLLQGMPLSSYLGSHLVEIPSLLVFSLDARDAGG